MINGFLYFQLIYTANHVAHCSEPELSHQGANLFRHKHKEVHDVLRFSRKLFSQLPILRGHSHRTGIEVAFPHHDAPLDNQGSRGKAIFLRP